VSLYDGWIEALSAQELNKRFYKELANWFFWSVKQVAFPAAARETDTKDKQNQVAVIRLLTRLIFIWFIKEKGLVPDALFDPVEPEAPDEGRPHGGGAQDSSNYYKAVLQNLFFATLNTENPTSGSGGPRRSPAAVDGEYLIHTVYRFRDAFRDPDRALALFKEVPFLNGGLFECLDRRSRRAIWSATRTRDAASWKKDKKRPPHRRLLGAPRQPARRAQQESSSRRPRASISTRSTTPRARPTRLWA